MKHLKRNYYQGIYIALIILLTACQSGVPNRADNQNTLEAHIDGEHYIAKHVSGFEVDLTETLLLTGASGLGEDIQLFLPKNIAPGSYTYEMPIQGKYQPSEEDGNFGFATEGNLTISAHDTDQKRITGTFTFLTTPMEAAFKPHTITEGSFNIHY